jgi:hypothetical protein
MYIDMHMHALDQGVNPFLPEEKFIKVRDVLVACALGALIARDECVTQSRKHVQVNRPK